MSEEESWDLVRGAWEGGEASFPGGLSEGEVRRHRFIGLGRENGSIGMGICSPSSVAAGDSTPTPILRLSAGE